MINLLPSIDDILGFLPSWASIKNKVLELKTLILGKITTIIAALPSIDDILGFLPSWNSITSKVSEIKTSIQTKITELIGLLPSVNDILGFLPSWNSITTKITEIKTSISTKITELIGLLPSVSDILGFIPSWSSITGKISEVKTLISTKITELIGLIPSVSDITGFLPSWDSITTKITELKTLITTKVATFLSSIPTLDTITKFLPDINKIVDNLKQFATDAFNSVKGLFKFGSISEAVATAINVIFLPSNLILGLIESMWNYVKGIFGFDDKKAEEKTKGSSFLAGGGIGGLIMTVVDSVWSYLKGLFSFGSSEGLDDEKKAELAAIKEMMNPLKQLRKFAGSIKGFFTDIFDMEKIKGFFSDIPLIGGFFGGDEERTPTDNAEEKQLITPIDSSSIIKNIFGEVNILDELSKVFSKLIDNLVGYLDTFLGEALGPAYTSRAEHIEELESKIADNLAKGDAAVAAAIKDYSEEEGIKFNQEEITGALNKQVLKRLEEEKAKPEDRFVTLGGQDKELVARLEKMAPKQTSAQIVPNSQIQGVNQRTLLVEQGSQNMATQTAQQPIIISNVDNSTRTANNNPAIPVPVSYENPDWASRIFTSLGF